MADPLHWVYGPANQCDDFTVAWTGGQPPFSLSLFALNGLRYHYGIGASSYVNGKGQVSEQLTLNQGNQFVAAMIGANGFAAGGISPIITVGGPDGNGASCGSSASSPKNYQFSVTPNNFSTCDNVTFTIQNQAPNKANLPVTMIGLIPGGGFFTVQGPPGQSTFSWKANVTAGTTIVFTANDTTGGSGGVSNAYVVGQSNDQSCISGKAPSSTSGGPSSSNIPTNTSAPSSSSGVSGGVIGGAVAAGVLGVILIALGIWYFFHRRRRWRHKAHEIYIDEEPSGSPSSNHNPEMGYGSVTPFSPTESSAFIAGNRRSGEKVPSHATSSSSGNHQPSQQQHPYAAASSSGHSGSSQSPPPPPTSPPRVVFHTDIQDSEMLEVPPEYREERSPLQFVNPENPSGPAQPLAETAQPDPTIRRKS